MSSRSVDVKSSVLQTVSTVEVSLRGERRSASNTVTHFTSHAPYCA
jgi:hypothetical protein